MENSNKKFWSFVVGSVLATAYIWLVELGMNATVPTSFQSEANFIINYYPMVVTATAAMVTTLVAVLLMSVLLKTKVSDHLFWLILPSLSFLSFALISANILFVPMLAAALPTLAVFLLAYFIENRDMYLPERSKVW